MIADHKTEHRRESLLKQGTTESEKTAMWELRKSSLHDVRLSAIVKIACRRLRLDWRTRGPLARSTRSLWYRDGASPARRLIERLEV